MKNKFLLLLIIISSGLFAQNNQQVNNQYSIKGIVVDSIENLPVEMAVAILYNAGSKSIFRSAPTDDKGVFSLNSIPAANYNMAITILGYDTVRMSIPQTKFNNGNILLDTIRLNISDFMLSGVTVTAEPPELIVKEDTLEYNAAAFRLQEGAVVEDLIKRLPGMEVDVDGNIKKPDGKSVRRVFVDGKEFFGDDPKMATKNLTVDVVDKVQVIDKKSDMAILTGVDDDEEETIINITIKKGMKKGWMGNVTSGLGDLTQDNLDKDLRYSENIMVNRFLENDQITFIANANNINNQGSTDRGNNVRSGRGGGAGRSGIVSSNTFGVNTAKIINDKLKFGGNIRYNYSDNFAENQRFRQNLLKDSTSYRRSSSTDRDYSNNVTFDGKLEYQMDSATTIVFSPSISYNYSKSNTTSYQTTMAGDADSSKVNESQSHNRLKSDGLDASLRLDISRKLSANGRRVSFGTTVNLSSSTGDGTNNSENIYYLVPDRNRILDQISESNQDRNSYNFRLTYVEPLGKNNFLNLSYNLTLNDTQNRRKTYNYDDILDDYSILDADYSKSSDTKSTNQNIQVSFNAVRTNYTYNIGLNISPSRTSSKSYIKDWHSVGNDSILNDIPGRTATNYAPRLDFTYRFNNNPDVRKNLRLRYNGRTRQPSVTQLDPTPNNTNPLNIRSGNPDLLPSFNHNISLNYNNYNRMSQSSLTVSLNHSFTQNEIINYTTYEEQTGVQFTQPINENGSWNSSASILFSKPFDEKKKLKFSTQTRFNYTNNVGYIKIDKQSERNVSKTARISENISLSYSNDWFYGQFRTSGTYSTTSNTVSANDNTGLETFNFNISYNTQITLPYSWSVSSDITYSGNRGMSSGYNKNETIWNAQLNKQIFKRKQGSIRFQITDILQQRLSINRNVTANYIEDVQSNAMTGYFMFSFSYRFNNIGGGRGNRDGNRQRGGAMQEYDGGGGEERSFGGGGNREFGGGGRGGR